MKIPFRYNLRSTNSFFVTSCSSWTLCHAFEHGGGEFGENITIFQDLVDDEVIGQKYCDQWTLHNQLNFDQCITTSDNILNCTTNEDDFDVQGLGCQLNHPKAENITDVLINFPQDILDPLVRDFGKGESETFFKDFNGATSEFNRKRKILKFYGTKFDLAVLEQNTNASLTEEVTIMADTVYMSRPIS